MSSSLPAQPIAGAPTTGTGERIALRTRIGVAVGAVMLALALTLAAVLAKAGEQRVLQLTATNLQILSEVLARDLSQGMDQFLKVVVDQTRRSLFSDPRSSVAEMREALNQVQVDHPEFAYVSIVDAQSARVIAASGGIFEGGSGRGRPTFEQGLKGPYLGDVHDAVRLAELLPRPANGETLRFLDVAAPIKDADGRVIRVFATHVGWGWTAQLRDQIVEPVRLQRGIEIFLVDTSGKVVLSGAGTVKVGTDVAQLLAAKASPTTPRVWPDGGKYLTSVIETRPHGQFGGFGWRVVARQPYDAALAAVQQQSLWFLTGAALLGLMAVALAWYVTGRIVRPVTELAKAAARAEAGLPLAQATGPQPHEVDTLHQALTRLADRAQAGMHASARSERQFAALAASLPHVVWQADPDGQLEYTNRPLGGEGKPAPQQIAALAGLMPAEDGREFESHWQRARDSGEDLQVRCRMANGHPEPRWCEIHATPVRGEDGAPLMWVGSIVDVHEIVTLAALTSRALEEERLARADAERVTRLRDEFMALVSHELRSPLSAITGWADILVRKEGTDPMIAKAGAVIHRNAQLQAALINDLLDMSAMMAGKLVLNTEPVDLSALAREVVLSHLHSAQQKGLGLVAKAAAPAIVDGDNRRLTQVLNNLVSNAIKFTPAGGNVRVEVAVEDGQAVLEVTDTGRGISPAFLPHVFERMRQEDGSGGRAGGLGLGLAIAKGIVELHGGTITVNSAGAGKGTSVSVTVPIAAEMEASSALAVVNRPRSTDADLVGLRVLLVDDEQDARDVAQVALTSLGARVTVASSGAQALELLKSGRVFDVLLSDVGMPQMDGLALMRAVRAHPDDQVRRVPAVALTAFALESDVQAGFNAGFHDYVAKPISIRRLSEAILGVTTRAPADS